MAFGLTRLLIACAAGLGLVTLNGCSGQQSYGADSGIVASKAPTKAPPSPKPPADSPKSDRGNRGSKPPAEASPTVQTPADNAKEGRAKASPPVTRPKETPAVAELIAAAKEMKDGAIDALAAAGPKAIPLILADLRRDDRRYSWATAAMAKMGPGAVEPVAALLNDSDYFMRKIAYMTLGQMGPTAIPALPALQRAAQQDRDPRNRGLAANAISQINRR
jgi:hypothetical protein